jgi:hypothetical protein
MTVIPAGTEVAFRITYLEMPNNPGLREHGMPDGIRLEHAVEPPVWFFLSMYDAVGRDYEWRDRFVQAEEDPAALAAFVSDPLVEMWVAYAAAGRRGSSCSTGARTGSATSPISDWCPRRWAVVWAGGFSGGACQGMGTGRRSEDDGEHLHARPSPRAGLLQEDGLPSRGYRGPHPCPLPGPRHVPTPGLKGHSMFETRLPPEPDKILRLMGMFAADPRPDKVDLGVGVYRSPEGVTPIMTAVKTAERRIWETQETKSYVGILGDPAYLEAMRGLILG